MLTPKQREEYYCAFIDKAYNDKDFELLDYSAYWLNIIDKREEELVKKIEEAEDEIEHVLYRYDCYPASGEQASEVVHMIKNIINPNESKE